MEKIFNYGISLLLLVLGLLFLGNPIKIWNTNDFFAGWWTLFVIVLALLIIVAKRNKFSGIFLLIFGVSMLAAYNHLLSISDVIYMCIAAFIILISLNIFLFMVMKRDKIKVSKVNKYYISTFGEVVEKVNGKLDNFGVKSLFGQVFLDLSEAKVKGEIVIDLSCTLGNIELILPSNVNLVTSSKSKLGVIHNFRVNPKKNSGTIVINSNCMLGEINIK